MQSRGACGHNVKSGASAKYLAVICKCEANDDWSQLIHLEIGREVGDAAARARASGCRARKAFAAPIEHCGRYQSQRGAAEMKIFFINRYFDPDQSATSRMTSSLAFALASAGWTVHVITSRQLYDNPKANLPGLATTQGVVIHRVLCFRFGRMQLLGRLFDYLSFYAAASWRLWRQGERGDVVVAGTDPPLFSICAALVSRLAGMHLVNWLQDLFPEVASALRVKGCGRLLARTLSALRDASLRCAAANVVPGEGMASYLHERNIPQSRLWVRHNWSDGSKVRPLAPDDNPLRRDWRLLGKLVVGYSGNMGRAHDFTTIIAAAAALRQHADIVFLLVGDGQHRAWVEAQVCAQNLLNVVLKPFQPEARLAESLSVPDIHLVSLRPALEGFVVPSKFYGAAAAGRGVLFIGQEDGEMGRLIRAGRCGATVAEGDPTALCAWILRLQDSPEICAAWGRNARALFDAQFDQEAAFASWRHLLATVQPQPLPRPASSRPATAAWSAAKARGLAQRSSRPMFARTDRLLSVKAKQPTETSNVTRTA
jgi:colanic acid biosynthesis glycosyl transferase WcaI